MSCNVLFVLSSLQLDLSVCGHVTGVQDDVEFKNQTVQMKRLIYA